MPGARSHGAEPSRILGDSLVAMTSLLDASGEGKPSHGDWLVVKRPSWTDDLRRVRRRAKRPGVPGAHCSPLAAFFTATIRQRKKRLCQTFWPSENVARPREKSPCPS